MRQKVRIIMKKIKTITSYAGNARFFAELAEEPIGFIPKQKQIPSPYAYSPTHTVYDWNGQPVIQVETKHKYYEVFNVSGMKIYNNENDAAWN